MVPIHRQSATLNVCSDGSLGLSGAVVKRLQKGNTDRATAPDQSDRSALTGSQRGGAAGDAKPKSAERDNRQGGGILAGPAGRSATFSPAPTWTGTRHRSAANGGGGAGFLEW